MTQEESIIKALEDYGGKASNKQIYERAMQYAHFGGSTPEATIRWWLQKSKLIVASEGQRGVWELLSYQEEIALLKQELKRKETELSSLKEQYSVKNCVTLSQIEAEIMDCPDWATASKRIDDINRSGILGETDWAKVSKRIQKAFKTKQQEIIMVQTDAMKELASHPKKVVNHFEKGSVRFGAGSSMNGDVHICNDEDMAGSYDLLR